MPEFGNYPGGQKPPAKNNPSKRKKSGQFGGNFELGSGGKRFTTGNFRTGSGDSWVSGLPLTVKNKKGIVRGKSQQGKLVSGSGSKPGM